MKGEKETRRVDDVSPIVNGHCGSICIPASGLFYPSIPLTFRTCKMLVVTDNKTTLNLHGEDNSTAEN
jgi:hypothetical protein